MKSRSKRFHDLAMEYQGYRDKLLVVPVFVESICRKANRKPKQMLASELLKD